MQNHTKFFLLRSLINYYLHQMDGKQTIGNKSKNDLTAEIIRLSSLLMSFGFYATKQKIQDLCQPLVRVLDGRGDERHASANRVRQIVRSLGNNEDSGLMSGSFDGYETNPLFEGAKAEQESRSRKGTMMMMGGQNARYASISKYDALKKEVEERQKISRWREDSDTVRVMKCKMNILNVLGGVANLRANYRIGQFLESFKTACEEKTEIVDANGEIKKSYFKEFELLFTSKEGISLDIEKMSDAPLDSMCMDLMMYESDELFETALQFLRRRYGQRRAALNFLPKVTLLNTSKLPIFSDFKVLDQEIQQLRFHMRSYDVWGVHSTSSPIDDNTFNSVQRALVNLVNFLYSETIDPEEEKEERKDSQKNRVVEFRENEDKLQRRLSQSGYVTSDSKDKPPSLVYAEEKRVPNKQFQNLMRNMGMAREVLFHGVAIKYDIMKTMREMKSKEQPSTEVLNLELESYNCLYDICKKTVFALAAFVDGNEENQKILFKSLPLLRTKMGQGMFVWDVVISIFQNNQNLTEICPVDLFLQFAEMLEDSDRNTRFLDFYINAVQPIHDGRCVTRNQNLAIQTIGDRKFR